MMIKKIVIVFFFLFSITGLVFAQSGSKNRMHYVKKGETLSGISKKYGVSITSIKNMNSGRTAKLKPGQALKIPAAKSGASKKGNHETKPSSSSIKTVSPVKTKKMEKDYAYSEKLDSLLLLYSRLSEGVNSLSEKTNNSLGKLEKSLNQIEKSNENLITKVAGIELVLDSMEKEEALEQQVEDVKKKSINDEFSASASLMSRYVWRGTDYGRSPAIQPGLEYAIGNFSIGAWGSFATNGYYIQEADLYFSYTFDNAFSITLTDYFFPSDIVSNSAYYKYNRDVTGHVFECTAAFNGTEDVPFHFLAAVNFYGADAQNEKGDNLNSTYIEVGYSGDFSENPYTFFLGFTPDQSGENAGYSGYYGTEPGIINIGVAVSSNIKITDTYELPFSYSFIVNPQTENIFLVCGINF